MDNIVVIEFLSPWDVYDTGEVAGFDKELSMKLVNAGKATLYKEKDKRAVPKT